MYGFNPEKMKKQAKAEGPGPGFKPRSAAHAQALNQAPDTIPGMFKPGEFVLPPDTVHAMGGPEALQGVVDATHTPAPDTAAVPRGFQPQVFFAQGGSVDDEVSRQKANSFGDSAAAAADPAVRQVQPAPNSPSNTFPGNRTQGASGFSGAPAGQAAQASTPAPAAASGMPARNPGPSELYMNDRAQELRQQVGAGNYAQAAGTAVRTAVQGLGMYGLEAADKVATPVINAAKGFGAGLFGAEAQAAPAPTPSAAAPAATPASRPVVPSAANPTDQRSAAGVQTGPTSTTTVAPVPTTADAATSGNQISPGVYQHGRGQYSDQAGGMGLSQNFTGQPNVQNNAAAENLARGFQPGASQTRVSGPAGVTAPTVLHSGNSWQARNDLRNLEVAASSITNQPGFRDTTQAWSTRRNPSGGPTAATQAYQTALAADIAARGAQPAYDMKAAQENAATQREGMQQAGANARTSMQEQGANAREQGRNILARDEFNLKKEASGFQTRAAKRMEDLQARYQAAGTEQERATIAKQIRDLSGKDDQANRFTVVPGGQEWDAAAGAMRNVPARVLNNQTGQFVDQGGRALPPIEQNPAAIAIKNNTSMTREQKADALRQLGY